jgi:hypothetical protein
MPKMKRNDECSAHDEQIREHASYRLPRHPSEEAAHERPNAFRNAFRRAGRTGWGFCSFSLRYRRKIGTKHPSHH